MYMLIDIYLLFIIENVTLYPFENSHGMPAPSIASSKRRSIYIYISIHKTSTKNTSKFKITREEIHSSQKALTGKYCLNGATICAKHPASTCPPFALTMACVFFFGIYVWTINCLAKILDIIIQSVINMRTGDCKHKTMKAVEEQNSK